MSKLRHPIRYWHWRYLMKGNIKVNVDLDKSMPIDLTARGQHWDNVRDQFEALWAESATPKKDSK